MWVGFAVGWLVVLGLGFFFFVYTPLQLTSFDKR